MTIASPWKSFLMGYIFNPLLKAAEGMEKSDRQQAEQLYDLITKIGERSLPTKYWVMELYSSLIIQKKALEHRGRLYGTVGDKISQVAVENRVKNLDQRIKEVETLFSVPRPSYGNSAAQQQKYKDFIEKVIEKGEGRALEELGEKNVPQGKQ